ncbi:MAG: TetR/AcrR family transcriptional regulator [Bacteroidota bacterium]
MEERDKELIAQAKDVFMQYGIKSVTMDDMSRHLGISKKTLYKSVKDKNDLVQKCLQFQCNGEIDAVAAIQNKSLSAIDEMFEIGQFVSSQLKGIHPSIHYDLEKYHIEVFLSIKKAHMKNMYECMLKNLKKGIKEGVYRKDLRADVITKIYIKKIDVIFDAEVFPPEEISFEEVYATLFRYHIRGIANQKGIDYLEKKEKQRQKRA